MFQESVANTELGVREHIQKLDLVEEDLNRLREKVLDARIG